MRQNVLDLPFDLLVIKVERDSIKREELLAQAMSKIVIPAKKVSTKISNVKLSEQEKLIAKSMGLNLKDIQALIKLNGGLE